MGKFLFIIGFLLCFQSDRSEFSWQESDKLKWSDFKGEPDISSHAAAVTASGITFSYSIEKSSIRGVTGFKAKVFAHFYPEHSWCKKEVINDHILNHEQFHFNITELHVRYLREDISKLKVSNTVAKDLDKLHKQANIDLSKMQNLYDTETNYSINKEEQAKWVTFVNTELKRLEKFKSN
ncbi:hypothetical protein CLV86_2175 [Lacinutrix venerupis]|uniref:DUF922 domain-containing protein n=1 Tax=Lacinutrix venerupis TaxID=1486034 RepID=UPI000EB08CB5|nr:hypothetical protein [Lacinutrix venerupis]RLJ62567.1 hypothetical protein CLV86_2175 [Lacinutrix venerupis]